MVHTTYCTMYVRLRAQRHIANWNMWLRVGNRHITVGDAGWMHDWAFSGWRWLGGSKTKNTCVALLQQSPFPVPSHPLLVHPCRVSCLVYSAPFRGSRHAPCSTTCHVSLSRFPIFFSLRLCLFRGKVDRVNDGAPVACDVFDSRFRSLG